jgi:hypothetical protein
LHETDSAATQETTDDFSWDDDEETPAAPAATTSTEVATAGTETATATATATPTLSTPAVVPSAKGSPTATSPRNSEESYDVVSRQASTVAATEDDEDSDWE